MYNAFNTVIYHRAPDQVQFNSTTDLTVRNSQFRADGTMDPDRTQPNQAGFGAATERDGAALGSVDRQIQLLTR